MTNLKTIKRALFSSVIAILVCFTMLLGTTFAWFTDSVTSNSNIIQTGTLKIAMSWAEGKDSPTDENTTWKDASEGAIFNNDKWEPGYTEAKHIKIENIGTLALKYKLVIVPNGEVENLADVIDVYFITKATQITDRATLTDTYKVGTLREMIEDPDGAAYGYLLPAGTDASKASGLEVIGSQTVTIALKMREDAGNDYQGKKIGTDFSIQLLATQYTYEEDGFDNQYDKDAPLYPVATAAELVSALNEGKSVALSNDMELDKTLTIQKNADVTIDLSGNTLKTAESQTVGINVDKNATLNIVNSADEEVTLNFTGDKNTLTGVMPLQVQNGATVNIENVNINLNNSTLYAYSGDISLKDCTLIVDGELPAIVVSDGSTITIENCNVTVGNTVQLGLISVDQTNTRYTAEINLISGNVCFSNTSLPVVLFKKYNLELNCTDDFTHNGVDLYQITGSYKHTLILNGVEK